MNNKRTEIRREYREVNGKTEVGADGSVYWMGSRVMPCPMCGIAQTNVDDCGEFGNPECPAWGIGRKEFNKLYGRLD